jgi:hypothetical protein
MGLYSDYHTKNPEKDRYTVNIEWVLKELDEILVVFTRNKSGLVPAPGGSGATKYLREDGVWAAPYIPIYVVVSSYFALNIGSRGNMDSNDVNKQAWIANSGGQYEIVRLCGIWQNVFFYLAKSVY